MAIKAIYNLLILIVLLISSRNIKILKGYQKFYLVLSIITWLLIVIVYLTKLIAIIVLNKLNKKFHSLKIIKLMLLISWLGTNISAYIIMLIAFLYDVYQIFKGNLYNILYECVFCGICIIFVCFTINDFYHLEIIFYLICNKIEIKKEVKPEIKTETGQMKSEEDEYEFDIKVLGNKMINTSNIFKAEKQKAL